jgi:hypothetical protein
MTRIAAPLCLACALLATPALAAPGGKLGTLERGTYVCEMPGDATTARGVPVPGAGFEVTNDSTYRTDKGRGTYLRTGDHVRITSGPHKGERYMVENENFLRMVDKDEHETGLRCIRLGAAGVTAPFPSAPCEGGKPADAKQTEDEAK